MTDADLLLAKFEEIRTIVGVAGSTTVPTQDHTKCKKREDCEKLYFDYENTDPHFLCVRQCSETPVQTYRYGFGLVGVQEYCKKDCPAPRDHVFTNAEGDFECTSDCAPVPAESQAHGDASQAADIASRHFTFVVGYNYAVSGPVNYKTCMSDCTIANDPNLSNTNENQCLYQCDLSSAQKFRTIKNLFSTNHEVCDTSCSGSEQSRT